MLVGPGPFVGRGTELERLYAAWQTTLAGGANAVLIAGEPGVGKTRLAGEWSRQAYEQGAAGAVRPLRRGPRRAVPAVRGSSAFAGAMHRCQSGFVGCAAWKRCFRWFPG